MCDFAMNINTQSILKHRFIIDPDEISPSIIGKMFIGCRPMSAIDLIGHEPRVSYLRGSKCL